MRVTFDPAKNERNVRLRGPEPRYVAIGLLGDRVHVLCFAEAPDGIRVISFRKANSREVNRYAKTRSAD